MRSLRVRLLAGTVGGILLLLAVFSLIIYFTIRSELLKQFDTALVSVARVLAASAEQDGNNIELEVDLQQMPEFQDNRNPAFYQLWAPDGTVVLKSPMLGVNNLPRPELTSEAITLTTLQYQNDRYLRVVSLVFVPRKAGSEDGDSDSEMHGQESSILAVARDADDLYGQLRFLRWLLLFASAAVIVLSFIIAAVVVRNGLRPLNSIAAEIAAITETSLSTRIAAEHVPAEVVPIKNRLNELMSRLEASFNRERRFNADVAHELRTPLSGIRSTIEVTLAHKRDADEYRQALSDCLEITRNMQLMVGNLLVLATLETQQLNFHTEKISIAELVDYCWRSFSHKASGRAIAFENHIDSEISCESDRQNLSIILSNILENATEYADEGGRIRAVSQCKGNSVEIAISNTGCRLTDEEVSQMFDAFWRGDSARSGAGIHCGLGLALVHRLIKALGGSVTAELQPGGIFIIKLIIPPNP